jgi:hypothetical protein
MTDEYLLHQDLDQTRLFSHSPRATLWQYRLAGIMSPESGLPTMEITMLPSSFIPLTMVSDLVQEIVPNKLQSHS